MKIDVQGYEAFLVKGAHTMFSTKPPVFVYLDYTPHMYRIYGVDGAQFLKDMIAYGYTVRHKYKLGVAAEVRKITLDNGEIERLAKATGEFELEFSHLDTLHRMRTFQLSF